MQEITSDISWIAVIAGVIASMALGMVWYNPNRLTGRTWANGFGVPLDPPDKFPALAMGMNTLGLFLIAWFVAVTAKTDALLTVILATIAFGVLQGAGGLFARATFGAVLVHFGYWVLSVALMIICQGLLG